ncbi:NADP-dependent oxidoreductase [Hanstruepera ponticola]|uniref:NADP-dependent oxidoreductase n=1 Tax=Hanstruepera ponticola TaxID=2042995 RepID=UPI0017858A9A|nr:NADP-dependent oxidoreductase [Hanstruepera ponticola]
MNKQLILNKRPKGMPDSDTWSLQEAPIPEIENGELLIQNHYISLDPAMRGWMNDSKSYIEPVALGDVMRAGTIGKVIKSNNNKFNIGQTVTGWGGVQQYTISNGENLYQVDDSQVPMTKFLGVLGMPGMTAYFGILEVGKIQSGDVVVVSGGAGAVGSVVGQIAKIKGCYVVGIAGGKEKCDYITNQLGFDAAIDYKSQNVFEAVKETCPKGIDVYFDNVGGEILEAALSRLRKKARIVICGAISQYNKIDDMKGPRNYMSLLVNRATMQGMVVMDYADRYPEAMQEMAGWMQQGKLKSKETIFEGIENFQETFKRLFTGDKLGKLILKVIE